MEGNLFSNIFKKKILITIYFNQNWMYVYIYKWGLQDLLVLIPISLREELSWAQHGQENLQQVHKNLT